MPLPRKREMVRPVVFQSSQSIRRASAVSDSTTISLFVTRLVRSTGLRRSFDLCEESGASGAFFPEGHGALSGYYEEVSCTEWTGSDGPDLWNGACLAGESANLWPFSACGNTGMELSLCLC
jgi:hypothetical protein